MGRVPLWALHVLLCGVSSQFLLIVGSSFVSWYSAFGFFFVFAWCVEPLVFGVESAGFFENPTISVGMVSRLSGSVVYLTYPIQDFF